MQRTDIEYLTHVWNFQTGCLNKQNGVCTLPCWAESISHRFHRDFTPQLHIDKLRDAATLRGNDNRVGVCFTGDLFGDWIAPSTLINAPVFSATPIALKDAVFDAMSVKWHNQFFFLTKCPWNYQKWGRFPDNAWLGATVCNDVMLTNAFKGMVEAQAKHKWLSIEPLLSWDMSGEDFFWTLQEMRIEWVVIGGQTHPTILPDKQWVLDIMDACIEAKIPIFVKDNLASMALDIPMHKQYPKGINQVTGGQNAETPTS